MWTRLMEMQLSNARRRGGHGAADREHLVDKREVLRDSPPDILLTNYKMLDFLLMRPEDKRLWQHNCLPCDVFPGF